MPLCTFPLGCDEYAQKNSDRCSNHQIRNATDRKLEAAVVRKHHLAAAAEEQRKTEKEARDKTANEVVERQRRVEAQQEEVIRRHLRDWNAQIDAVFDQVVALRATIPGANAGRNTGGATIPGGTDNPLVLSMTGPTHNVTSAQILHRISGFDSSDSGLFKFRRASGAGNGTNILIHCR